MCPSKMNVKGNGARTQDSDASSGVAAIVEAARNKSGTPPPIVDPDVAYLRLAYSVLACCRMGMSGSASFQRVRKSWYAALALTLSPKSKYDRAKPSLASAAKGEFKTIPR